MRIFAGNRNPLALDFDILNIGMVSLNLRSAHKSSLSQAKKHPDFQVILFITFLLFYPV